MNEIKLRNTLPMGNTVIMKEIDQEDMKGGIIITGKDLDQYSFGEIVWLGPGVEVCRIGMHVKYRHSRVSNVVIEDQSFVMGKEDLCIEIVTDYFEHGGSLSSLIAKEQAKKIVGQYFAKLKDFAPEIAERLAEILKEQQ